MSARVERLQSLPYNPLDKTPDGPLGRSRGGFHAVEQSGRTLGVWPEGAVGLGTAAVGTDAAGP